MLNLRINQNENFIWYITVTMVYAKMSFTIHPQPTEQSND